MAGLGLGVGGGRGGRGGEAGGEDRRDHRPEESLHGILHTFGGTYRKLSFKFSRIVGRGDPRVNDPPGMCCIVRIGPATESEGPEVRGSGW
nr:hypothetical protein GCM10020093_105780 [Planobispora longispora]